MQAAGPYWNLREDLIVALGAHVVRIADAARPGEQIELDCEVTGTGPELVWMHGLSGSLDESRPLCRELSQHFTVLSFSTRGHGRSSPILERDRYTYDVIATDLDRLLDEVGFDRPVIGGGSHGANTALKHEVLFPGRAKGLLLVAPGANALRRPKRPHWWLIRSQLRLAERRGGEDGLVRAITGHSPADPGHDRVAVAAARTHDFASLKAAMRFIADQQVVDPSALATIEVPTVVAGWDHDPLLHPISVARALAAGIPGARFEEIDKPAGGDSTQMAVDAAKHLSRWALELS